MINRQRKKALPKGEEGQGATEYLFMLGAVLIVALVSVSLLNHYPTTAQGTAASSSKVYWQGDARPMKVPDAMLTDDSQFIFTVENAEAEPLTITGMAIDGQPAAIAEFGMASSNASSIYLGAGEKKYVQAASAPGSFDCSQGQTGGMQLEISYLTRYGTEKTQVGQKDLIINCNIDSGSYSSNATNQSGNETGGQSCEAGVVGNRIQVGEQGEYYFVMDWYEAAAQTWLSLSSPRTVALPGLQDGGSFYGYYIPLPPAQSMGTLNSCDTLEFTAYPVCWWVCTWGPYYASNTCNMTYLGGNHWKAQQCDDGLGMGYPGDDYEFEVYKA